MAANSQNDDEIEDDARMRAGFGAALALTEEAMTDTTAAPEPRSLAELFASWGEPHLLNPNEPRAFEKLAAHYADLLQLIHRLEARLSETGQINAGVAGVAPGVTKSGFGSVSADHPAPLCVVVPMELLKDALNYIRHCGANAVMRGEPHPQYMIVQGLEHVLAAAPVSPAPKRANWERFDIAYKRACESSQPQDWLTAALLAQQVRNDERSLP